MFFLFKPFLWIAALAVCVGLFIVALPHVLSVDNLKTCGAEPTNGDCRPVDVIISISGGDTEARVREAVELFNYGWAPRMIFSGAAEDHSGESNAAAMRDQAVQAGVPESAITLDEQSKDTTSNATYVAALVRKSNAHRVLLVTSPYHQRRASIEFSRKLGDSVEVVSHPTPYDIHWSTTWWLHPTGWWLAVTELGKLLYVEVNPYV